MDFKKKTKEKLSHSILGKLFENLMVRQITGGIILFVLVTFILSANFTMNKVDLKVGQPSPKKIVAPKTVVDVKKTEELREKAAQAVPKAYDLQSSITDQAENDVVVFFNTVQTIRGNMDYDLSQKINILKETEIIDMPSEITENLFKISDEQLKQIQEASCLLLRQAMQYGVKKEHVTIVKNSLPDKAQEIIPQQSYRPVVIAVVQNMIRPNLIYNATVTEQNRQSIEDSVEEAKILKDQLIIQEGDIVTIDHIAMLEALGLQHQKINIKAILGIALFVALCIISLIFYIFRYKRELFHEDKLIILLEMVFFSSILLSKIISNISPYMAIIPIVAGVILLVILLDVRLALISGIIMTIMMGTLVGNEMNYVLIALFACITAAFSMSKASQRTDLVRWGIMISLVSIIVTFTWGLMTNKSFVDALVESAWGVTIGLSAALAGTALPFLENIFDITTGIKLLELSNPSKPLLRRLLVEAPGSYHHSIIVGNLAEAAAEEVGADPLLVRVGAYYHDIGKIKRPYFYIENQLMNDNPHEKLTPTLSALIITLHVKDGVEIARKQKLPQDVIDIIEQHHGTSLISYFYHQAAEQDKTDTLSEEKFRYPGPKPQTKEAAIVMLADSTEAAVRSLSKPVPNRVEKLVKKIIRDRLNDGQLDECPLTLRDLDRIGNVFVTVLSGIFHSRIEYPETQKALEEEIKKENAERLKGNDETNGIADQPATK